MGLQNPRSINLDNIDVWAQIHKLLNNCLKEPIIRGMACGVGEIKEVQIKLPRGIVGSFFGLKVKN